MEKAETFENYPAKYVLAANLFNLLAYAMGAYIMLGFGPIVAILYVLYILLMEFAVFREGCVNCYYYGRICFCGKGALCAKLMKKGNNPKIFTEKEVTWKMFIPSFMVAFMPIVGAIVQLLMRFDWILLVILIVMVPFYFMGNAIVHGAFACKYCKQREIGCKACELFDKK